MVVAGPVVVVESNEVISAVVSTVTVIDAALSLLVDSSIQINSIRHM